MNAINLIFRVILIASSVYSIIIGNTDSATFFMVCVAFSYINNIELRLEKFIFNRFTNEQYVNVNTIDDLRNIKFKLQDIEFTVIGFDFEHNVYNGRKIKLDIAERI